MYRNFAQVNLGVTNTFSLFQFVVFLSLFISFLLLHFIIRDKPFIQVLVFVCEIGNLLILTVYTAEFIPHTIAPHLYKNCMDGLTE